MKDQNSIGKTKGMESEKGEIPSDREMDSKPTIGELSLFVLVGNCTAFNSCMAVFRELISEYITT